MAGYFSPTPRTRKRLKKFRLIEISSVDRPAMDPARAVIMKRCEQVVAEAQVRLATKGTNTQMSDNLMTKAQATDAWNRFVADYAKSHYITESEAVLAAFNDPVGKSLYKQLRDTETRAAELTKAAVAGGAGHTLDEMAATERLPHETKEAAYARVLNSPAGRVVYKQMKEAAYSKQMPNAIEKFERSAEWLAQREGIDIETARKRAAKSNPGAYTAARLAGMNEA
jgi:hypothetical protein